MSSENNIDSNDSLSNEEELRYNKIVNLLDKNINSDQNDSSSEPIVESLQVLESLFEELDSINSINNTNSDNTQFGILNYTKIFAQINHKQFIELFQCLCTTKNVDIEEYNQLQPLFYFISGALIHDRKHENLEFHWKNLVDYLDLDVLIRTYNIRKDFPEHLSQKLLRYFNTLPNIELGNSVQEKNTYSHHFALTTKLKNVFYFSNPQEVLENETLINLIDDIMKFVDHNSDNVPELRRYFVNAFYNGLVNEEQAEEIDSLIYDFIEDSDDCGEIYYDLLDSLTRNDQDAFFNATDRYLEIYWNDIHSSPQLIEDSIFEFKEFSIASLTLEDKIVAFFTPYFETIQLYNQQTRDNKLFINLLLSFYDKELFNNFMSRYNIPYNVPIRETHTTSINDTQIEVTQHYFSLFEISMYQGKYNIATDLLEHSDCVQSFYAKVVEDDQVYSYHYKPFSDLLYLDESAILFLIEHNVFTHETMLPIEFSTINEYGDNGHTSAYADLFYFFIHNNYDQAFLKLYFKSKAIVKDFTLTAYQPDSTLFLLYLVYLKKNNIAMVNPAMISIFENEGYSLYAKTKDNISAIDFIATLPVKMAVHITVLMESLFKKEQDLIALKPNDSFSGINSLIIPADLQTQKVEWFNRDKLEQHFKYIAKDKESASSNIDYIKSMLSDNNHLRSRLVIKDESIFDNLLEKFPNFEEVIRFYQGQFRLKELTGKIYTQPILLLGEAGIGKTKFAKELAISLNTGYTFLDMASITANWILSGNNGSWKSAKQGKILEALMKSKNISPVILMDELDKARGGEYDPTLVLYQLLEEVNSKEFTDEFVDVSFNASGIIYIACANSIQQFSEPLLDRFKVFNISKPNDLQLETIITNMYIEATQVTKLFDKNIDPQLMKKLKTYSLRSIKTILEESISQALLALTKDEIKSKLDTQSTIVLNVNHLKDTKQKSIMGF